MLVPHERFDTLAETIIGRPLQQRAKGAAPRCGDDGGFAHGRTVSAQLADNFDRAAMRAVPYDFEAPCVAVGFAQSAEHFGPRTPIVVADRRNRRSRRRTARPGA